MGKLKYGYGWVLKFVLAAVLLGVGIYMVFADQVVYTITGVGIVIFSVFRVVPLLKSLNKEALRTINLIEIIFDTIIGGLMIYIALTRNIEDEAIWATVYRYSLAFFFYARGLVFFNSVVFFGEKTEIPKFWVHIGSLTLGTVIASVAGFGYETVGLFLLFISLLGASYLGYDGFGGYTKYREYSKQLNEGKAKEADKGIQAPGKNDNVQKPIVDEPEDKRPYVN
jgi:threonine/homoserine/homoserine lactone efflux protein